jgi:hypothetical protein
MNTITTIPPEVAAIIPYQQLQVTEENLSAFAPAIGRLQQQLAKCPNLRKTECMKEHPALFHYFTGGTDMYICEYDKEDGLMFGFTILNGDLPNSEWGYIDINEIRTIPVFNLDYHFEEQSIEAALFRRNPEYYPMPLSLQ